MDQRVLSFLTAGRAEASPLGKGKSMLLEQGDGRRLAVRSSVLGSLFESGLVRLVGTGVELTGKGRDTAADPDRFRGLHRDLEVRQLLVDGSPSMATVNHNESPLAALARRKDKSGASFLAEKELRAGERLRVDYTRGQIIPRLGANWDTHVASGRRDGGMADLTDAALGARLRVEAAIKAVGPELSGVLIDVCCFLKGLETVEAERNWPTRSAKVVLKVALGALGRHYEPERTRSAFVHWGADDYRPTIPGARHGGDSTAGSV